MTTATNGRHSTASVGELFVAIIAADIDLLRDEFDAIIAAEWPDDSLCWLLDGNGIARSQPEQWRTRVQPRHRMPPRGTATRNDFWSRERAPPNRDPQLTVMEGG